MASNNDNSWKEELEDTSRADKKLSQEELVAKLLSTGLARSSMEAKQMAQSMLHVEKTQKQFETEIEKAHNIPRQQKTVNAHDLVGISSETVDTRNNSSASQINLNEVNNSHAAILNEVNSLKYHVARQQQIIERLEQDITFIRSLLQNAKIGGADAQQSLRTPTAAELLDGQDKAIESKNSQSTKSSISFDSDDDIFMSKK